MRLEPAQGKLKRASGGQVEPLEIVDGQQYRCGDSKLTQERDNTSPDRTGIGSDSSRFRTEEGRAQRKTLRIGKRVEGRWFYCREQIAKRREGQPGFGRRRAA